MGREHERGGKEVVARIQLGARIDERLAYFESPRERSEQERRHALLVIGGVRVGSRSEECRHQIDAAQSSGEM